MWIIYKTLKKTKQKNKFVGRGGRGGILCVKSKFKKQKSFG